MGGEMRKPLTGTILGVILGWAVAIILQQNGTWPLDRLTVWLLPALLGFLVMWLLSIGKEGSIATFVVSLVVLVPMAVWGALGVGDLNSAGYLDGGCTVNVQSSIDAISGPSETSRRDPFKVDPDGSLSWTATSPTVFDDYGWEIWVDVGGVAIPVAGETNQDNDGGSQSNEGNVGNVTEYARSEGINIDQIRGVFMVGGFASTCEGLAFLELVSDPFATLISQIAAAIAIIIIIFIIVIMILSRGAGAAGAAGATGAAGAAAAAAGDEGEGDGDGGIAEDIADGAAAAGFGVDGEDPVEFEEGPDPADED
jgi:hypothetical protein